LDCDGPCGRGATFQPPALKLLYLVLNLAEKEGKMPPREWIRAKAQLAILFEDRFKLA
jgi:putative transposase